MAEEKDPSRRAQDLAVIVPILGVVLMLPPVVGLFAQPDRSIFGLPLIVVYLFGLWFALILMAYSLARHLNRAHDEDHSE